MASTRIRREVLGCFKALHKARKTVFEGDAKALNFAREKINEEFRKNSHLEEHNLITEKVQLAKVVAEEMRTTIVQAKEVKPGVYEAKFNKDTVKLENVPFKDCDTQIEFTSKKKKCQ